MPSPAGSSTAFERQLPAARVWPAVVALAKGLGEVGVGGATIHSLLSTAVRVECVSCGISLAGSELADASVVGIESPSSRKLERLRLGYCARKTCSSGFYVIRCADVPEIPWKEAWQRAEQVIDGSAPEETRQAPGRFMTRMSWIATIPWRKAVIPVGVLVLLSLTLSVRSGCRVPGISRKARVFIVTTDPGHSQGATKEAGGGAAAPPSTGR